MLLFHRWESIHIQLLLSMNCSAHSIAKLYLSEKFNNQGTLNDFTNFIVNINYVTFINTPFISELSAAHRLSYSLHLHVMAQSGHNHNLVFIMRVLYENSQQFVNLVLLLVLRINC